MKILFVTSARGIDYEADAVFHGLVSSGNDVTDSKYLWYLSNTITEEQKRCQYGMGFTMAGNLPDRSAVRRDGIEDRISSHEFDIVVYGSIGRCSDYWDLVHQHYRNFEIAIIDGEDDAYIRRDYKEGVYFKRELTDVSFAIPISFAIPREKFLPFVSKEKMIADLIPGRRETYRFTDEESYYKDYSVSRYAYTWKKAGWDCLRHYEILASGCLPIFIGFEACPKSIMINWPWRLQAEANRMFGKCVVNERDYNDLRERMVLYGKEFLTTEELGKYVIETLSK